MLYKSYCDMTFTCYIKKYRYIQLIYIVPWGRRYEPLRKKPRYYYNNSPKYHLQVGYKIRKKFKYQHRGCIASQTRLEHKVLLMFLYRKCLCSSKKSNFDFLIHHYLILIATTRSVKKIVLTKQYFFWHPKIDCHSSQNKLSIPTQSMYAIINSVLQQEVYVFVIYFTTTMPNHYLFTKGNFLDH